MKNRYIVDEDITTIYAEHKGKEYKIYLDTEDLPIVSQCSWHIKPHGLTCYAKGKVGGKNISMHRLVKGYNGPLVIDHADRNGLNNMKSNLRICTVKDNSENSLPVIEKWYKQYIE
jgi:hypothetical protein